MSQTSCTLRCERCGFEQRASFAHHLSHGWPSHCGRTMSLVEVDEGAIETAVDEKLAPVTAAIAKANAAMDRGSR